MRLRRIAALVCVVLTATALAACGSSKKSSSSSSSSSSNSASTSASTSASASAPKVSGPAFKLGMICSCSGPQSGLVGGSEQVADAWADTVNAAGGINGHPVKMYVADDTTNAATTLEDAKKMVTSDHIQALVGDMSFVDSAFGSYFEKQGVPVVGGIGNEPLMLTNPDFFATNTQIVVTFVALAQLTKAEGKTHFGLEYCAEDPICAQANPIAKAGAELSGLKYSSGEFAETASSYTAPCLSLKSDGVDALYITGAATYSERFLTACSQQGYSPLSVNVISQFSPTALQSSTLNNSVGVAGTANPYDTSTPAVAQYQAALNKYEPGFVKGPLFSYANIQEWTAGLLFQAAAKAGKLTPSSTPAQVKAALYKIHGDTLGGLTPPLSYTPGRPAFLTCYFKAKISNGKFVSLNGNKEVCLSPAQVKAVGTILKAL